MAENPTLVSYQDQDGYTALHRASYSDHSEVIKYLIAHGAQVEKGTEDGWTPLHCATHWNSYKAARQLVNSNANVNAQTNGGRHIVKLLSNYTILVSKLAIKFYMCFVFLFQVKLPYTSHLISNLVNV